MNRYISTIDDLCVYVDELMGREANTATVLRVANRLARDPDAPTWGDDWSVYVEGKDLWEMAEGASE